MGLEKSRPSLPGMGKETLGYSIPRIHLGLRRRPIQLRGTVRRETTSNRDRKNTRTEGSILRIMLVTCPYDYVEG